MLFKQVFKKAFFCNCHDLGAYSLVAIDLDCDFLRFRGYFELFNVNSAMYKIFLEIITPKTLTYHISAENHPIFHFCKIGS